MPASSPSPTPSSSRPWRPRTPFLCVCVCMRAPSCLTLCDPMDYRLPGSSTHGISQARILEWVAISYSRIYLIGFPR